MNPQQPHPRPRNIRVIQLNCGKNNDIAHSCLETATKTADIVLLQEPSIGPWSEARGGFTTITHPSFDCLLPPGHNNNKIKPRVATFVSKTHPHLKVSTRPDLFNDPYLQVMEVSAPGIQPFLLFNIYNERYADTQQYTIERLLRDYQFTSSTIIAGDMNAHHYWWNSKIKEERHANTLVTKMEESNYYLINEPDIPTFFQYRKNTN